jgi:transcriptional regulator with XRE-family HTH domain
MEAKTKLTFGERVRRRRDSLGITQEALAQKIGIHRPVLSDIETGQHSPTLRTIERVASALGLTVGQLLGDH